MVPRDPYDIVTEKFHESRRVVIPRLLTTDIAQPRQGKFIPRTPKHSVITSHQLIFAGGKPPHRGVLKTPRLPFNRIISATSRIAVLKDARMGHE